ncbi:uncharacterized protein LOC107780232 isoform X1 [Nicotiana tabacum]|uniref:Uncharacterized protein LOC107780232 isoform X1 n=1 Tax=Nicotiana tabacum TaxID=4097 RepID=A0AC58ULB7_TOBAC
MEIRQARRDFIEKEIEFNNYMKTATLDLETVRNLYYAKGLSSRLYDLLMKNAKYNPYTGIEGLADTIFSDLNSDTTLEMKEGTNLKADGEDGDSKGDPKDT